MQLPLHYFLLIVFLFLQSTSLQAKQAQTICLNMIVKNESQVIERCLATVKPFIDYWVIVDTGSTDGTQEIIREFLKEIPGELQERPWVDFAHNRNEALALAKGKADYVLIIDADEILRADAGFKMPDLNKDFYYIMTEYGETNYARVQLVKNQLNWKWMGVLHEAIDAPEAKSREILKGLKNVVNTDGFRSKDPLKYHKDAKILEAALVKEPYNSRYVFYLAQSYKDAGEYALAIQYYQQRVKMGGWDEEIFWSLYQIGILEQMLEKSESTIAASYETAYRYRPTRVEPLYQLANYYRLKGNYEAGYKTAKRGLALSLPTDILLVQIGVYDYRLLMEFAVCAYWTENYSEALLATQLLLSKPHLPENFREVAQNNLKWINLKIEESNLALKN